jgi:cytochrome P450
MVLGPGLAIVNGDAHKRQRRVMQPAFAVSHIKALFANVMHHVAKVVVVFSSVIIDLRQTGVAFDCGEE